MKKPALWIIVVAAVSAALLRDPFMGPIIGLATGLMIGLPAYYILSGILELFIKYKGTLPSTISAYTSIVLIIILQWIMFHPPAKLIFSTKLASPIPASVQNLKSKTHSVGPDGSLYLRFNISKEDLYKILQDKSYKSTPYKLSKFQDRVDFNVTLPDNSGFSFSADLPWDYKVTEENHPELFIKSLPHDSYTLEYIIYDPNQKMAFYELATF